MKTKLKIAAFAAVAATGCIAGISKTRTAETSAITLANVEALTNWEVTIDYDKCCTDDPELNCITSYMGLMPGRSADC